jgi:hypothetical protein
MPIKTFRGLIADGTQDTIVLHTNDGSTGYRIVKFKISQNEPGQADIESTVKIYKIPQTVINNTVDFSDNTLLGVAHISVYTSSGARTWESVIFDGEIFNQDIYVTHQENSGNAPCNYYIELEQVKLDLNENTVATLKDIRNITAPKVTPV